MKLLAVVILLVSSIPLSHGFDRAVSNALVWENTELASEISDYTLRTNIVGSAIYAITRKEKRKERIITTAAAHGFNTGINYLVKLWSSRERPNGKDNLSFWSGHTSAAFTSAGLICMQTSDRHCSYSLALAAITGYLRIAAKYHWPSDVIVGAGVGFFNGKVIPNLIVKF